MLHFSYHLSWPQIAATGSCISNFYLTYLTSFPETCSEQRRKPRLFLLEIA